MRISARLMIRTYGDEEYRVDIAFILIKCSVPLSEIEEAVNTFLDGLYDSACRQWQGVSPKRVSHRDHRPLL